MFAPCIAPPALPSDVHDVRRTGHTSLVAARAERAPRTHLPASGRVARLIGGRPSPPVAVRGVRSSSPSSSEVARRR